MAATSFPYPFCSMSDYSVALRFLTSRRKHRADKSSVGAPSERMPASGSSEIAEKIRREPRQPAQTLDFGETPDLAGDVARIEVEGRRQPARIQMRCRKRSGSPTSLTDGSTTAEIPGVDRRLNRQDHQGGAAQFSCRRRPGESNMRNSMPSKINPSRRKLMLNRACRFRSRMTGRK